MCSKTINKKSILILLSLFFVSCAHHRDVRPGVNGVHIVKIKAANKGDGSQDAIAQAQHFCETTYHNTAAFIEESSNYEGSMDEETYKKAKTASKVAEAIGGAGYVFGGQKEKNVGGAVAIGGHVSDSILGEGYTTQMKFKCQ
jgi:hypothetical protein